LFLAERAAARREFWKKNGPAAKDFNRFFQVILMFLRSGFLLWRRKIREFFGFRFLLRDTRFSKSQKNYNKSQSP
jgi:hypothetical protein